MTNKTRAKEPEVLIATTSTWKAYHTFEYFMPCKNRLRTALRALIRGNVRIVWQEPYDKTDQRLKLRGKRVI